VLGYLCLHLCAVHPHCVLCLKAAAVSCRQPPEARSRSSAVLSEAALAEMLRSCPWPWLLTDLWCCEGRLASVVVGVGSLQPCRCLCFVASGVCFLHVLAQGRGGNVWLVRKA
jgi:hypothetical protein